MNIILFSVILFLSLLIGVFGFSQIIGTLKYFKSFNKVSALFTILFWSIILGFVAFAIIKWLNNYSTALYIGFVVSFLLSLKTKPDKPTTQAGEDYKQKFGSPTDFCNISFMTDKEKDDFKSLTQTIHTTEKTYNDALNNLGDLTESDIELLYKSNAMSQEQYNQTKSAYESLLLVKETYPKLIAEIKQKRKNLYAESLLAAYENGKLDKELYLHLSKDLRFL